MNGNNGQRLRPTTFDQMAICKMYGCAPTCGKQLSFCDNGEELFFSTRKCDGFNDCSDGSDEWGCPKKCCSAFTFQGQEYKLGKSNVAPLYSNVSTNAPDNRQLILGVLHHGTHSIRSFYSLIALNEYKFSSINTG